MKKELLYRQKPAYRSSFLFSLNSYPRFDHIKKNLIFSGDTVVFPAEDLIPHRYIDAFHPDSYQTAVFQFPAYK